MPCSQREARPSWRTDCQGQWGPSSWQRQRQKGVGEAQFIGTSSEGILGPGATSRDMEWEAQSHGSSWVRIDPPGVDRGSWCQGCTQGAAWSDHREDHHPTLLGTGPCWTGWGLQSNALGQEGEVLPGEAAGQHLTVREHDSSSLASMSPQMSEAAPLGNLDVSQTRVHEFLV